MKYVRILVVGLTIAFSCISCDRSDSSPASVSTTDKQEAQTAPRAIPYKDVLETGLTKQFNYLKIPRGEIQIMSGLSSQMEAADLKRKRFPIDTLKFLDGWKNAGLISYTEREQNDLSLIGNMGTRFFTVTPLQKAIDASDPNESTPDTLCIPLAECTVESVVKDVEYSHPSLSQSDDFRLVVGTYTRFYNKFVREIEGPKPIETLKFRALLKVNPFNQTYSFQTADWGNPNEDVWITQNIPN